MLIKSNVGYKVTYLLLIPAFLLFVGFIILPSIGSIYFALTSWDGISPVKQFIGLRNFFDLFQDKRFYNSVRITFILTLGITLIENSIALLLALLVDRIKWFKGFLRSMFYIPVLLSGIITGFIWMVMMNYSFGVINQVLSIFHINKVNWIGDPNLALLSIMITLIWKSSGFYMVIYLAGLQGIPLELIEASRIDGANSLQQFRHITFPMLAGTVTINMTLSLINGLKVFDQVAVMTDGGPGFATETVVYQIYKVAFADGKHGYGTSIAIVLFIVILILAGIQVTLLRKREVQL